MFFSRSSIKDYEDVTKKDRQAIARLNNEKVLPCISDAADTSLKAVMKVQGMRSATENSANEEVYDNVSLDY